MITVNAIHCPKCGDTIYSRHRHDFRYCTCGTVAIDGGFDYTKICAEPDAIYKVVPFQLEVDATKEDLLRDYLSNGEMYGRFNKPVPVTPK